MTNPTSPSCPRCGEGLSYMCWDTTIGATVRAKCVNLELAEYGQANNGCDWRGQVVRTEAGFRLLEEHEFRVYLLRATAGTGRVTLHVGIAKDVGKRVLEHKRGKVKQTAGRSIVWLGNSHVLTHGDALREEARLKRLKPEAKLAVAEKWPEQNLAFFFGVADV